MKLHNNKYYMAISTIKAFKSYLYFGKGDQT